jgi:hypothetical protein
MILSQAFETDAGGSLSRRGMEKEEDLSVPLPQVFLLQESFGAISS